MSERRPVVLGIPYDLQKVEHMSNQPYDDMRGRLLLRKPTVEFDFVGRKFLI